jgi:hypothetical protein
LHESISRAVVIPNFARSTPSNQRLIQKLLKSGEEFPDLGVCPEIQHAVADRPISERDKLRKL